MDVVVIEDDEEAVPSTSAQIPLSPDHEDCSIAISGKSDADEASVCFMECGCCFVDVNLDDMVQCSEGHLFCMDCLKRYADEAIHGQGKSQLLCMTADCGASYPRSQMKRALTDEVIQKFDERVQEESLNMANLTNLVRCPACSYAAEILDENQQVFVCIQCEKRSCRHCKEDWVNHEGLTCNQVEKNDETSIRTKYEERMTEASVRLCPKCKAPLIKDGGCNKVTCRCGGTICYICRKSDIDYNHFCQHIGPHQRGCKKCKSCSLWTDAEADDKQIIEQLKKEGKNERVTQGFTDDKDIGAPIVGSKIASKVSREAGGEVVARRAQMRRELRRPKGYRKRRVPSNDARQIDGRAQAVPAVVNMHGIDPIGLNLKMLNHNALQFPGPPGLDLLSGLNHTPPLRFGHQPIALPVFDPYNPFLRADIRAQRPENAVHRHPAADIDLTAFDAPTAVATTYNTIASSAATPTVVVPSAKMATPKNAVLQQNGFDYKFANPNIAVTSTIDNRSRFAYPHTATSGSANSNAGTMKNSGAATSNTIVAAAAAMPTCGATSFPPPLFHADLTARDIDVEVVDELAFLNQQEEADGRLLEEKFNQEMELLMQRTNEKRQWLAASYAEKRRALQAKAK